jgi:hypothetical protein
MLTQNAHTARLDEDRRTAPARAPTGDSRRAAGGTTITVHDADIVADVSTGECHIGDPTSITFAQRAFPWVARGSLFVVYFWFGLVKLAGLSEATGLAKALTAATVGMAHFEVLFKALAVLECVIGVLCLIPAALRLVIPLLGLHLAMVCAPMLLVRNMTWQSGLVPTMDGQYIIKNVLIVAVACGLVAHASSPSPARNSALDRDGFGLL